MPQAVHQRASQASHWNVTPPFTIAHFYKPYLAMKYVPSQPSYDQNLSLPRMKSLSSLITLHSSLQTYPILSCSYITVTYFQMYDTWRFPLDLRNSTQKNHEKLYCTPQGQTYIIDVVVTRFRGAHKVSPRVIISLWRTQSVSQRVNEHPTQAKGGVKIKRKKYLKKMNTARDPTFSSVAAAPAVVAIPNWMSSRGPSSSSNILGSLMRAAPRVREM